MFDADIFLLEPVRPVALVRIRLIIRSELGFAARASMQSESLICS